MKELSKHQQSGASGVALYGHRYHRRRDLVSAAQTKCLDHCSCIWKSGKITVECSAGQFNAIPAGIGSDTQVLQMTGNIMASLKARSFQSVGLTNLQRISLNRCGITALDEQAFYQVSNLVDLDISNNFLTTVPTNALQYCPILRKLYFSHNVIKQLTNESFAKFKHLQTIDLSHNTIELIESNAFQGLKNLKQLYLSENKLSYISGHVVRTLPSLYELTLHYNPWHCDCKLRDLRDWMLQHNIPLSYSPNCSTPSRVTGKEWKDLHIDDFACLPIILTVDQQIHINEGENASITCMVESIPLASVDWLSKGRAIKNMSLMTFGRQMYLIRDGQNGLFQRTSTLYIMNALEKDAGSYTCVGSNKAGTVSSNLSLNVLKVHSSIASYSGEEVAGMVLGTIFIFLIIFVGICVVVLRSKAHYQNMGSATRTNQSAEANRCKPDERKLLSVHMNHNTYVTQVATSNHLELKPIANNNDSKHLNHIDRNDRHSVNNVEEEDNCLMNDIQSSFKTMSVTTAQPTTSCDNITEINANDRCDDNNVLSNSDVISDRVDLNSHQIKEVVMNPNCDDFNADYSSKLLTDSDNAITLLPSMATTSSSAQKSQRMRTEELLKRRASDITQELNKRFSEQKLMNGQNPNPYNKDNNTGAQHSVRFSNNATIYNYQCQRFGHSMESLDSNGYDGYDYLNYRSNGNPNHNSYDLPNGSVGPINSNNHNSNNHRSLLGLPYSLRPIRGSNKQSRRSGGSLAALLAINARDSPDEGLGDEREYETDILD
ncbi:uncharacterized protein LOC128963368 [Oppia nitens]|uniref:uncharacterized protein LOC128963368 n=1 Tax=Oppia nitens TaxID=1686743 RepID=UPI0023DB2569|nr:uncharacterized protein LOC128963368 [Oppia nitens]